MEGRKFSTLYKVLKEEEKKDFKNWLKGFANAVLQECYAQIYKEDEDWESSLKIDRRRLHELHKHLEDYLIYKNWIKNQNRGLTLADVYVERNLQDISIDLFEKGVIALPEIQEEIIQYYNYRQAAEIKANKKNDHLGEIIRHTFYFSCYNLLYCLIIHKNNKNLTPSISAEQLKKYEETVELLIQRIDPMLKDKLLFFYSNIYEYLSNPQTFNPEVKPCQKLAPTFEMFREVYKRLPADQLGTSWNILFYKQAALTYTKTSTNASVELAWEISEWAMNPSYSFSKDLHNIMNKEIYTHLVKHYIRKYTQDVVWISPKDDVFQDVQRLGEQLDEKEIMSLNLILVKNWLLWVSRTYKSTHIKYLERNFPETGWVDNFPKSNPRRIAEIKILCMKMIYTTYQKNGFENMVIKRLDVLFNFVKSVDISDVIYLQVEILCWDFLLAKIKTKYQKSIIAMQNKEDLIAKIRAEYDKDIPYYDKCWYLQQIERWENEVD